MQKICYEQKTRFHASTKACQRTGGYDFSHPGICKASFFENFPLLVP